jgi:uncharacterized protein with PIN domain
MKDQTFVDKVNKHFGFLEADFGFKVIFERNSDIHPQTDGIVKHASDTTLLIIDSESGQAAVRFVRIQDDERYYLDPVSIHEYLNTSEEEKRILLSRDAKDQEAANVIFRNTFLLTTSDWQSSKEDAYVNLEKQLKNYANWLKVNSELCLLGNFSRWPKFYEYKINRLIADELRRGAKEVVLAVVKDENGAYKTIKRPIFQREWEHLARLREEVLGK